ncbi:MAG: TIGR01440 family protein [Solobacterium sp.]|nr:TIGR01440 family protein [Solobacterium sp.]
MSENSGIDREFDDAFLKRITEEAALITEEIISMASLTEGDLFVVGCSSSEIAGERIGTCSSLATANAAWAGIHPILQANGIFLAAQCCEHLNRALIVEREVMKQYGLEEVNVIPQPKAGGSFAVQAWENMRSPVAVEHLNAHAKAGLDIGGVLIGMHIHPVVVPLKLHTTMIGNARVIAARSRPKFVGGSRAVYNNDLL